MPGEPIAARVARWVREGAVFTKGWRSTFIEYSDYQNDDGSNGIRFDSYMVPEEDLQKGDLRLLEVDNPLVLPTHTHINVVVTAADVLHCWSVPSLGIKIDAVPGRLNQVSLFIKREGVFYGQCSEICGANHGFMVRREGYLTMEGHTSVARYNSLPTAKLGKVESILLNIASLLKGFRLVNTDTALKPELPLL